MGERPEPGVRHRHPWQVLGAVMLPTTLAGLSPFLASVALDHIAGGLSAAQDEITWAVTAHIVAYSIMLPLSVWMSGRLGERRLFVLSVLVFCGGSAVAGLADSLSVLIAGRIVQGLAGGALVPLSQLILLRVFERRSRPLVLAIWFLGVSSGSIFGPVLGGYVTESLDWRWLFHLNIPLGLLALVLLRPVLAELPQRSHRSAGGPLDAAGLALLVVGLGSLQTLLQRGEREQWWESPRMVTLALTAGIALVLFVRQQLRARHPIMDLTVFRDRTFALGCLLLAALGWCQSTAVVLSAQYSARIMDHGALLAGLVLAPAGVATAAASLLAGAVNPRLEARILSALGAAVAAWGFHQIAGLTPEASVMQLMSPRVVVGCGLGLLIGSLPSATLSTLSLEEAHRAAGAFNLVRNLGGSLGIAVMSSALERGTQVHQAHLSARMPAYFAQSSVTYRALLGGGERAAGLAQDLAAIAGRVREQALFLAFLDGYRILALLLVLCIPLLVFMRRPPRATVPALEETAPW